MLPSILIVDDEIEITKALARLLRKDFKVVCFNDPQQALTYFCESPTHIVLSDMRMPEMNGAELLKEIAKHNSRSKRVALTGYADINLAQQAINEGHVSFYLNKPWDNDDLKSKLFSLIEELKQENRKNTVVKKLALDNKQLLLTQQSQLILDQLDQGEKKEESVSFVQLKKMSNELLMLNANIISMYSGEANGHSLRVAQQSKALCKRLGLEDGECLHVYLAGLFHRIGLLSIAEHLKQKPWREMNINEQQEYVSYTQVSHDIMASSSLLKPSAKIVKKIYEQYDDKEGTHHNRGDAAHIGAQVLQVVLTLDLCINGFYTGYAVAPSEAFEILKNEAGLALDNVLLNKLADMLAKPAKEEDFDYAVTVSNLTANMVLAHDIIDVQQHKLLSENTQLTDNHIQLLLNYQKPLDYLLLVFIRTNASIPKD